MKSLLQLTALALPLVFNASTAAAQNEPATPALQAAPAAAPATASLAPNAATKKGLTWGVYPPDPITGTITVSCQGAPASPPACNPYVGDTPGTTHLPLLCFNKLGFPFPVPNSLPNSDPAYWSGGVVATTAPVSPINKGWTNAPRSTIDAYCVSQFGPGWVVAEHHMGQGKGWKFGAYGNVGKPGRQRFWVHINNQPNGNVWLP